MALKASIVGIAQSVLFANFALPLQAKTLHAAQDETLLERAGRGAAEADGRRGMVTLQHLIDQHAASEAELHARAAETWRRYAKELANNGCGYKGGLLPCPNGNICHYTGQVGVNVTATVEYRGNIIKTHLSLDPDAELGMPEIVMFMGAGTGDAPAMLLDIPQEYQRTANPVILKMFFVEDTDNVTEQCPHDSQRVESIGDHNVSFSVENNHTTYSHHGPSDMFMGMEFELVSVVPVGHTVAFEIPAGRRSSGSAVKRWFRCS